MVKKKVSIIVFIFLLIIPLSFAKTDYNETGNFDTDYQLGNSIFNSQLDPSSLIIESQTVTNPRGIQLVSDLDNDGINEIIVVDLPLVRLLAPNTLDSVAGENIGVTERVSNILTFDIDDDGFREVILVLEESEDIRILEWNGTEFKNDSSISLDGLSSTINSEFMIKCGKPNNCLLVWTESVLPGSGARISITAFNSTSIGSQEIIIEDDPAVQNIYCLPKIRSIAYENYNGDGNRYIFSAMKFNSLASETIRINYIDISDNLTLTQEFEITATTSGLDTINPHNAPAASNCLDTGATNNGLDIVLENYYTSPLVFDFEDESDGLETVVGIGVNLDEFKMTSYFNPAVSTSELDDYPEIAEADGFLLSNPFRANAIDDSGNFDFCVMGGFVTLEQEISLLCAQEKGVQFPEDTEYKFSTDGFINISLGYRDQSVLTHSIFSSGIQTDEGNNLDEVLTSYGVFSLDPDTIFEIQGLIFIKTLNLIFDNPKDLIDGDSGSMISVDAEKINIQGGSEDLIFMNQNNIFYIDDGRVNLPVNQIISNLNPCIDSVWKINTSFEADVRAFDPESDNVNIRVILYADDSNEQDSGFLGNFSSGQEITISQNSEGLPFSANKTIANGKIRISARDIENLDTVLFIDDIPFNVGFNGVEFNDCSSDISTVPVVTPEADAEAAELAALLETETTNNAIITGLTTLKGISGLGGTLVFLIIMMVVLYGIWTAKGESSNSFGVVILALILLLLIGFFSGVIPVGIIITIVVIGLVILAMFITKFVMGTSTR